MMTEVSKMDVDDLRWSRPELEDIDSDKDLED